MKKILILLLPLLLFGCGVTNDSEKIKGYYKEVEMDWSGDVDDTSSEPYKYLEITDNRMFIYVKSSLDPAYYEGVSEKYYILEGDQLYFDYYKLEGSDWKNNINEISGGVYTVTFEGDDLILTEYFGETLEDGYKKGTYVKIDEKDRLLEQ